MITSLDPEVAMKAKTNAKTLKMSDSAYIAMAVAAEVEQFDHRKEEKKACENAVKAKEDQFKAEQARDAAIKERDQHSRSADLSKSQYEESQAELVTVKAKLTAYQQQGFWGRVFGRVPMPATVKEGQHENDSQV